MRNEFTILALGIVFLGILTAANSAAQPDNTPAALLTPEEHRTVIRDRVTTVPINLPGISMSYTYLKFDDLGEPADISSIRSGPTLQLAASYYAMYTGDFDVSLNDLLNTGFWPFATFDEALLDQRVHSFSEAGMIVFELEQMPESIRDSSFLLNSRLKILTDFYRRYFYESDTKLDPVDASRVVKDRVQSFWMNPVTSKEMTESTELGDFRSVSLAIYNPYGAEQDYDILVPLINVRVGSSMQPLGGGDQCCIFEREQCGGVFPTSGTFTECFDNLCPDMPCYVEFKIGSSLGAPGWGYTKWVFVECADCDPPPTLGSNQVLRENGARAPDSIYGGAYATILSDGCAAYRTFLESKDPEDPQYVDAYSYCNFIEALKLPSPVASAPGALCQCE
jgi:hypothetical protein